MVIVRILLLRIGGENERLFTYCVSPFQNSFISVGMLAITNHVKRSNTYTPHIVHTY